MAKQTLHTIGLIGGGNMGAAILNGLLENCDFSCRLMVAERDAARRKRLQTRYKVMTENLTDLVDTAGTLVLAVKPQDLPEVLKTIRPSVRKDHLVISIAAGVTTAFIEKALGGVPHVVRTMPNLPAQIGEGITAVCGGASARKKDVDFTGLILKCVGKTVVVPESQMDAVTAVSGSGPAYVFYVVECLQAAAKAQGLSAELSRDLVTATLSGSLNLLAESPLSAGELRERVTSKGGTTAAALAVLNAKKMNKVWLEALTAAKKRAGELRAG